MSNIKVNVSALATGLKENREDYEKIFAQEMVNGFAAKNDMISLPITQKVALVREELGNVTQPGRTGKINNPDHDVWAYKEREAELKPAKVDITFEEEQLYKLSIGFLARRQPGDPRDIHSFAGRAYLMARLNARIAKEVNSAIYRGQLGFGYDNTDSTTQSTSMFQGGLNLFDGLKIKTLQGYATTGTGAVGDIPASNKVSGAASSITVSNILTELAKLQEVIYANQDLRIAEKEVGGKVFIDPLWFGYIADALDALPYKTNMLVQETADGEYTFKKLPKTRIISREYMASSSNMFWTVNDNLFYLHQDTELDVPSFKIQEVGRGLQVLIDWQNNVDYADGRYMVLYK